LGATDAKLHRQARDSRAGADIVPGNAGAVVYVVPASGILWVKNLAPLEKWGRHFARYSNGAELNGQDENTWFADLGGWGDGQSDLEVCDFYVGSRGAIAHRTGKSQLADEIRAEYRLRQRQ
jgi:hypothetical protein